MIKLVEVKLSADFTNQPCYNVVLREDDGTDGCILGVQNIDAAMGAALKLVDSHVAANAPNVTYDRLRSARIETEYLIFEQGGTSDSGKTLIVHVRNKGDILLGRVQWRGAWRKYVFTPHPGLTLDFDAACLRDIAAFTTSLTLDHRRANRGK